MEIKTAIVAALCLVALLPKKGMPDQVYQANQQATRLYERGEYEKALAAFDAALLVSPEDPDLRMNRAATLYKLGRYEEAAKELQAVPETSNPDRQADLYYNLGNALFNKGRQAMQAPGGQAMDAFKGSRDAYIRTLDFDSHDRDAKWNLQLAQQVIDKLEQQQEKDQKNDQNKDQKNSKQNQGKNRNQDDNQQNKNDSSEKNEEQDQPDDQDGSQKDRSRDRNRPRQEERDASPRSQPQQGQGGQQQLEKEEAERILQQFADDADSLNKPPRIKMMKPRQPEKDW